MLKGRRNQRAGNALPAGGVSRVDRGRKWREGEPEVIWEERGWGAAGGGVAGTGSGMGRSGRGISPLPVAVISGARRVPMATAPRPHGPGSAGGG